MKELREFIERMDAIEAECPINEEADNYRDLFEMLEEVEDSLHRAQEAAGMLEQSSRNRLPSSFSGQLRLYLIGHLDSFMNNSNQPGSIASLRRMLEEYNNDGREDYED